MRPCDERQSVLRLIAAGVSDGEVTRRTGIPRSTVGRWRRRGPDRPRPVDPPPWRPSAGPEYCYVLGLYLGDGHIVRSGESACLQLTLDMAYPALAAEARQALARVFPDARALLRPRPGRGTINVQLSSASLPAAFPQCGPGRKHERSIVLADWQVALTRAHPESLIRGLIHSDGCRSVNRFSVQLPSGRTGHYEYPRYFFSNLSGDIRRIFCEHCDLLGIHWTLSNPRNVSVARRESVALLDEFVGPKA